MVFARRLLTVFLITLLVGLLPIAYADPPDPTWLGGLWDDDDFDTVVAFIASTFAVITPCDVDAEPCLVWLDSAEPAGSPCVSSSVSSTGHPRAPPLASLPLA